MSAMARWEELTGSGHEARDGGGAFADGLAQQMVELRERLRAEAAAEAVAPPRDRGGFALLRRSRRMAADHPH